MRTALLKMVWAAWILLIPGAAVADDADVVAYRQNLMKSMDAQFGAVMLILTARAPEAHIHLHMESLLLTADIVVKSFEPKVPGGRAPPELWDNWPAFSAAMSEFHERLTKAVVMSRTEGAAGALQGLEFVSCQRCHDTFRKQF